MYLVLISHQKQNKNSQIASELRMQEENSEQQLTANCIQETWCTNA